MKTNDLDTEIANTANTIEEYDVVSCREAKCLRVFQILLKNWGDRMLRS